MINIKIITALAYGALLLLCVPFLLNFKKVKNRFITPPSPKRDITPIEPCLFLVGLTLGAWGTVWFVNTLNLPPEALERISFHLLSYTCFFWCAFLFSLIIEAKDHKHDPDRKLKKVPRKVNLILWGYWLFSIGAFVMFLMETFKY